MPPRSEDISVQNIFQEYLNEIILQSNMPPKDIPTQMTSVKMVL